MPHVTIAFQERMMRGIFVKTLLSAVLGLSIYLSPPLMAHPYGHGFHRGGPHFGPGGHHRFRPMRRPYFGPRGPYWGPRFGPPLPPPVFNDGWGWGWGPGYWYGGNGLGTGLVVGGLIGGAVGMEVASSAQQVVYPPAQINIVNAPIYPPPPPELPPAPPWFQPAP
ncbi:hypothetical protein [Sorlinia euscelidii]